MIIMGGRVAAGHFCDDDHLDGDDDVSGTTGRRRARCPAGRVGRVPRLSVVPTGCSRAHSFARQMGRVDVRAAGRAQRQPRRRGLGTARTPTSNRAFTGEAMLLRLKPPMRLLLPTLVAATACQRKMRSGGCPPAALARPRRTRATACAGRAAWRTAAAAAGAAASTCAGTLPRTRAFGGVVHRSRLWLRGAVYPQLRV